MSGIPHVRRMYVTPLSPVHMGTDEDYTPTRYVIEGDALYEFDHRALARLPARERQRLEGLLAGRADDRLLRGVQGFIHSNREWLIAESVNVVRVAPSVAVLYKDRVGKVAQQESGGKKVINRLEIERASYRPDDRRLYFPGTGLKGAMRTALLDAVNQGRPGRHKEKNLELQQRLFEYTMRELHHDPLRLVQVGDCHWQGDAALNSAEILFAVNRKKAPVTDQGGRLRDSMAEAKGLYQILECAAPFRSRAFRGELGILDTEDMQDPRLPRQRFGFTDIARACQAFYGDLWKRERDLLRTRGYLDEAWDEQVQAMLDDADLQRRLADGRAFLLRVGRHSGAEAVTLNNLRSIRIMKGKNEKAAWETTARTLWLASEDRTAQRRLRPFGWVLVELFETGESPADWSAGERGQRQIVAEMGAWLTAVQKRQQELKERNAAMLAEEARREAEAAAREAAAREAEARLAAMTPEERQIAELEQQLEADRQAGRKEPGGVLNEKRWQLLQAAQEWTDSELRARAASVIRETVRYLKWSNKRKKDAAELLEKLEERA